MRKLAIGSDHHGVEYKSAVGAWLADQEWEVVDLGSHQAQSPSDYPDIAAAVADLVSRGEADRGVLICGSGVGMAVVANKFPQVRAGVCTTPEEAQLTRRHNDLNVLCLSGGLWQQRDLLPVIQAFLSTEFDGGRHQRRVEKISAIETRLRNQGSSPNS